MLNDNEEKQLMDFTNKFYKEVSEKHKITVSDENVIINVDEDAENLNIVVVGDGYKLGELTGTLVEEGLKLNYKINYPLTFQHIYIKVPKMPNFEDTLIPKELRDTFGRLAEIGEQTKRNLNENIKKYFENKNEDDNES